VTVGWAKARSSRRAHHIAHKDGAHASAFYSSFGGPVALSIPRDLPETHSVGYAGDPTRKSRMGMMSREQFWFFHPFRVRYSEIDGQGVVFNAHYLTYFDTTITEYFRALGYDQYADARKTGIDFHIVKSVIEYKAPILFDQELEVGARVVRIGNSSLVLELAIFLKSGLDALATGEIVWVYTSQQTHRPVSIPDSIREFIARREPHLA
jgi:acyl-CoA thioester hydrolase